MKALPLSTSERLYCMQQLSKMANEEDVTNIHLQVDGVKISILMAIGRTRV